MNIEYYTGVYTKYYNDYTAGICGTDIDISTSDIGVTFASGSNISGQGIYALGTVTVNGGTLDLSKVKTGFAGNENAKYVIKGGSFRKSKTNEYGDGVATAVDGDGNTAYYATATVTSSNVGGEDIAADTVINEITFDNNTKYGAGTNTRIIEQGKLYMYVSPQRDISMIKTSSVNYGGALEGSTTRSGNYYQVHNCTQYENSVCTVCGSFEPAKLDNGYYLIYDEDDYEYVRRLIIGDLKNGTPANGKINIKLMNDLETEKSLGSEVHPFKGIYDGGYHILSKAGEKFQCVDGATIKNLKFTDSSECWLSGLTKGTTRAGLILEAKGNTVTIENVLVTVNYYIGGYHTGRNPALVNFGTLVGKSSADLVINNCGYSGGLRAYYAEGVSAMVGECSADAKVSIKNSYININWTYYYSGTNYLFSKAANTTLENCYHRASSKIDGGGWGTYNGDASTGIGSGEVSNGSLTNKLNKGISTGPWKQTLEAENEGDVIDAIPNHTGKNVAYNFVKQKYDNHNHNPRYELSTVNSKNDTVIMGCDGCGTVNCTLEAPENAVYKPGSSKTYWEAKAEGKPADAEIKYYENGDLMSTKPYEAGTYTAKITIGGKTASVQYTIAKYDASNETIPEVKVSGTVTDVTKPEDVTLSIDNYTWKNYIKNYTVKFYNVTAFYYDQSEYAVQIIPEDTRNIETVNTKVNISVQDTTIPTAKITLCSKDNKKEDTVISGDSLTGTLKYFMKDSAQVKFEASDNDRGSGIKSIQWFVSDTFYANTSDVDENATWVSTGEIKETISSINKKYIYVKATDNAGNSYITGTEGIVVYKDSEQFTNNISFTKTSTDDVEATVKLNGNTLKDIYLGDSKTPIAKENYTIDDEGVITFKHEYLDTLQGKVDGKEYTLTMHYNPAKEEYVDSSLNDAPATTNMTLYVYKQTAAITDIEDLTKVYNHEVVLKPQYQTISDGTETIEWYKGSISDTNKLDQAPMNAGKYVVVVKISESDNYKEVSDSRQFEIKQRPITIVNVQVEDTKVYDGNTKAKIIKNGELSDNLDGENLTFKVGKATYANKNVDTDKVVTYSEYELTGSAKDNYVLTQPENTKADITKKPISISLSIKNKQYDGLNTAEYDEIPSLVGVVSGDEEDVSLTNGVPTFDNVRVGDNISISFTEFSITGQESDNYSLIQPSGITANIYNEYEAKCDVDYTVSTPNDNGWLKEDFIVTAKTGYKVSMTDVADESTWSEKVTGSEESADSTIEFYLKNLSTGAISKKQEEHYKLDKNSASTKTIGKVYYDEDNFWNSFTKELTLHIFRNTEIKMNVEAQDLLSGVESVEYYEYKVSDMTGLTIENMNNIECWKTVEDDVVSQIEDEKQFVYYIRIIDKAGNITYISTDVAEYDITLPSITEVEDGQTYYTTQVVQVNDRNLDVITLNGDTIELTDNQYSLNGNVDMDYVVRATDKAGNVSEITVTMKAIAHLSEPIDELDKSNVNSTHQSTINEVAESVKAVDKEHATEEEIKSLEDITTKTIELTKVIEDTKKAMDSINKKVSKYDISKVNSADKPALMQLMEETETLIKSGNLSDDEMLKMTECKDKIKLLLNKISEVAKVVDTDNTKKVEDITANNVTTDDKDDLKAAKEDLEEALDKNRKNYTKEEIEEIKAQIKNIEDALKVIERVEKVEGLINKLGDGIRSDEDAKAVENAKKAYDELTDYEKSILDKELKNHLEKLVTTLEEQTQNDANDSDKDNTTVDGNNDTDHSEDGVSENEITSIEGSAADAGAYIAIGLILVLMAAAAIIVICMKNKKNKKDEE